MSVPTITYEIAWAGQIQIVQSHAAHYRQGIRNVWAMDGLDLMREIAQHWPVSTPYVRVTMQELNGNTQTWNGPMIVWAMGLHEHPPMPPQLYDPIGVPLRWGNSTMDIWTVGTTNLLAPLSMFKGRTLLLTISEQRPVLIAAKRETLWDEEASGGA